MYLQYSSHQNPRFNPAIFHEVHSGYHRSRFHRQRRTCIAHQNRWLLRICILRHPPKWGKCYYCMLLWIGLGPFQSGLVPKSAMVSDCSSNDSTTYATKVFQNLLSISMTQLSPVLQLQRHVIALVDGQCLPANLQVVSIFPRQICKGCGIKEWIRRSTSYEVTASSTCQRPNPGKCQGSYILPVGLAVSFTCKVPMFSGNCDLRDCIETRLCLHFSIDLW